MKKLNKLEVGSSPLTLPAKAGSAKPKGNLRPSPATGGDRGLCPVLSTLPASQPARSAAGPVPSRQQEE